MTTSSCPAATAASPAPARCAPAPRRRRALALLGLATLLAACASTPSEPAPAAAAGPARPALVVFLVVDGLPMRQVSAVRHLLAPDGFARFLDRGAWYAEAHYGHAYTVTAAGHATLFTGASPQRHGVIGNDWRDRATGAPVYCTGDTAEHYLGSPTDKLDGTSPRNLQAETLGDVMRRADPRSKVIAVSGKDRGAILPAGRSGTAYMYMNDSGRFASSTYYMPAHPAWVEAYNATRPADRWFKAEWRPLLPREAYGDVVTDDPPWFGTRSGRLPATLGRGDAPDQIFYTLLLRSPYVDAMALDFARAAIDGEQLGRDAAPDLLAISLSGHDYVNHAFSAESLASYDHLLQLDRLLQDFFHDLDTRVGRDRYVAVLSADHGFMPAPEWARGRGLEAGRASSAQLLGRVNTALQARFGVPKLVREVSASALQLNPALLQQHGLDADTVADAARDALRGEPAVAAAYTRREMLAGAPAGAPFFAQMRRSWNAERSGDVPFALKPYWILSSSADGTTHGSPHREDTHVPILTWGPRWAGAGRVDSRVETVDIAPTLAGWLGLPPPAAAEGRPLPRPAR
ncbi:alkaline phosphatase family protein [Piscinibacter sakaiensis]|uniref:Alkaline phosphatase n=1 Tax=Piscinibacter sakaiensis TaxID=1547922 RepID=A0A0K8NTS3_PISS1|nr:alkaline phosphatase family protein [Piscinibacter sakaiensis]GAP33787.1 alkaline phosphatase [Piscinibacter sakaiensis]